MYALDWLRLDNEQQSSVKAWLDGQFGDPFDIGRGKLRLGPNDAWDGHVEAKDVMERIPASTRKKAEAFAAVLQDARALIRTEHFHNWQVAFPGVWDKWNEPEISGWVSAPVRAGARGRVMGS